ncbi:hypothetical protein T05_4143 [Trichinella murrelli]|uniref:Uncharacterized protein n=1 Tax=Trichinella murrelli TaxID=144512 RepID=A0A0V0UAH6_9BILA|nr:hypothetical protein T05_4143 [Trichinella murrelli]
MFSKVVVRTVGGFCTLAMLKFFLANRLVGSQEDGRDKTTAREIDDYSNDKLGAGGPGGWLARTVNEWLAHSGCYDFGSIDLAMVIWRSRPSGGFFWYFIDPQLALGHSDLADGVRVLFSSYPRLLAASPYLGHTD